MESIALRTANPSDRIALRAVRLRSRLGGMSQKTTIEQMFVNLEPRGVEAVYTFPLAEGAAVCAFEVVTGDRVLTGAIDETSAALDTYDEAIDGGDGAFLAEQVRPDVFTVRVGNLKPRQAATIRLTYVCPLDRVDRSIRVAFPTTVAPRYATAAGTDPVDAAIDGDALNPPHVLAVPYELSLDVVVDLGRAPPAITSPSHAIRIEATEGRASRVTLAGGVTEMDRDVVLNIDLGKEHEPTVQAATGPDGAAYLAVTFVPEFDVDDLVEPSPGETVFVLDCSGSMQGESIRQATAALELCLRSLGERDTFNVCRFGSTWEMLGSEPLPYSQHTLDRALRWIDRGADMGGTELYGPLRAILPVRPSAGAVRQVILLTDGQVTNEPAVIDLARAYRSHNRVFTFGIGPACSAYLVKGIARATGGAAEFISTGERIEEKVLRTFGRLNSPVATDVSIDWDGADVQTLAELPPVFDGDVFTAFGRAAGKPPAKVTLSCTTPAGPRRWAVASPRAADDGGLIATMWARRTIQSLEEVNAVQHSQHHGNDAGRERELLLSLSKQFGLLCSLTTFVAIEHRSPEERAEGKPASRRVPVVLARGWGGIRAAPGYVGGSPPLACMAPSVDSSLDLTRESDETGSTMDILRAPAPSAGMMPDLPPAPPPRGKARGSLFGRRRNAPNAAAAPSPIDQPITDPLTAILLSQSADGWFSADAAVDREIVAGGGDPAAWRKAVLMTTAPLATIPNGECTLIALLVLRRRFGDREPLWRRAAAKAVRALANASAKTPGEVESILGAIAANLTSGA